MDTPNNTATNYDKHQSGWGHYGFQHNLLSGSIATTKSKCIRSKDDVRKDDLSHRPLEVINNVDFSAS